MKILGGEGGGKHLQRYVMLPCSHGQQQNTDFSRARPQEILAGFYTCLCLSTLQNKVRKLPRAAQFCVPLFSQFSLITGALVKTCLL